MEAGEREIKKAFEDVTTRNVKAAIEYGNETRKLVRELENKVASLDGLVRQYEEKLAFINKQLVILQSKVFSGGTN